ncbi:dnaJ homolog subfamily C member 4-like [Haliotis rufescens]|uniref:dnaJ homolog subfamily C member 4-like n=1 Tax=Haliotis rufescens TaxID=6454 RepID=UPI001EAFC439|nr:dnaJ homolog subfamily C member 4-like [Haliotis rufescens]
MFAVCGRLKHTRTGGHSPPSWQLVTQCIRLMSRTHYEVLGVDKSASSEDVRKAFLQLSKQLHPDVNRNDPKTHEKFVKLNAAYSVLSKSSDRHDYDVSLASHLHHRHMGGSRAPPYGPSPSGNTDGEPFWDETIWHMRNHSKDAAYEEKSYYGIRGIKKMSNFSIVVCCMGLMLIGATVHYFAIVKTTTLHKNHLDARDMKFHAMYSQAKEQARINGNELQLKILKAKLSGKPEDVQYAEIEAFGDKKK